MSRYLSLRTVGVLQPLTADRHQKHFPANLIGVKIMRFSSVITLFVILVMSLVALNKPATPAHAAADVANPFLTESTLPFHAPPFDKIKDSDYQPAIEAGMKDQLAEIEKIANDPAPATFANTLEAMERSGALL